MNVGLGHLTELKAHLLAPALRSETTYDAALTALGQGVAEEFDRLCNRRLARAEGQIDEFSAEECFFVLQRYPIEEITGIEVRGDLATGWVDQGAVEALVANIIADSGIVLMQGPRGRFPDRIRFTYDGGYWFPTAPAVVIQSGSVAITQGGYAADVAFPSAFAGVPAVKCSCISPEGEAIVGATAYEITAQGCTVRLSAATPAGSYSLSWVAVYGESDSPASVIQEATVEIGAGVGQFDVMFAEAFDEAPVVVCQVVSPSGGNLVSCAPSVVTTTGFRALLSWTTDAATYKLAYVAVSPTAAAAATTCPDGATALPPDLKQAWLQQCQHVWLSSDCLGNAMADAKARAAVLDSLGKLNVLPVVERTLRRYIRRA